MFDCNNQNCTCQDNTKMGIIYLITNLLNGKKYVGQTRQTFKRRMTEHKRDSNRNRPGIETAIKKYGWENFKAEIIETCPVELLNEREIFWIAELNSKYPIGYNLTDGGDGGRGFSPSAETRKKISDKMKDRPAHNKGKRHTAEARAKMSAAQKAIGNVPPSWKGKKRKHSLETRLKISATLKGTHHSEESRAKMSVSQKAHWAKKKAEKNLETKNK